MSAVVDIRGLAKSYGRHPAHPALVDLDLRVEAGEVFGYLGPNGAGKTTTLRLLMGFLRPDRGSVHVFGLDSWRDAPAVHRRVGYVPGEPALYERMTGRELLTYLGHLRGRVDRAGVGDIAARLDAELDQPVRTLSKGNRQKVALVLALAGRPDLLVLDEPTSGLDPLVQQQLHELLLAHARAGGTVLLSSHVLSEVQRIADRVGIIRAGRLVVVERLADLRAKSLHHVTVLFAAPVSPAEFASLPGVRDLQVSGTHMSCAATQPALDALVKQLGRHRVVDLSCEEASLDETFLAYYGEETRHAA